MEQQTLNPYFELGVEPGVTQKQLKQAYRQSVMRYHPDTSSGNGNAQKFRQVTEAYKLLQKMNAYQSAHAGKKTVSRASNLRQKFSSVFQNNKQQQKGVSKAWWEKSSFPKGTDEKIKVNRQKTNLSMEELINCVELSENQYVRQVALEAIAAKKNKGGVNYLLHLLQNTDASKRADVIKALGQCGIKRVNQYLFPYVKDKSIEVSAAAVKALESIDSANRSYVVEILRSQASSWKSSFFRPLSKIKNQLYSVTSSKRKLGEMLLSCGSISEQQLEIALLLQKKFPLLLGQILRYLEYVSIPEIQNSIASQKKFR